MIQRAHAPYRLSAFIAVCAVVVSVTVAFAWPQSQAAPAQGRGRGIQPNLEHPILPIGAQAPDFALPGIDGKVHKLSEYTRAKVLAIVFECNHCPMSQLYEGRIDKLYKEYRSKGVTFVAINPNNPKSIRLNEQGYTDVNDSLEEMKIRAKFRGRDWPYLYDGDTQAVSIKYGVVATPHIYLFDQDRKLQYQGRIDDNHREDLIKSHDARNALDAMLEGRPVPVTADRGLRLHDEVDVEGERRRTGMGQDSKRAGDARPGRHRRPEEAARERHRQGAAGQLLVNRVRHVREPVPRSRDHVPDVPASQL